VLLKGVTAGVVHIVRSFLALFTGRRRKDVGRNEAAAAADAAAAEADVTAMASLAADMAGIAIDVTAIAADAVSAVPAEHAPAAHTPTARTDASAVDETASPTDAAAMMTATPDAAKTATEAAVAAAGTTEMTTEVAAATAEAKALATEPAPATTATGTARTGKPQGRKVMISGFDMQAEIAKLAERIIEPLASKLTAQELEQVTGQIRDAFEQLNVKRTEADASLESMAVNIVGPVQPRFTEAERRRVVNRLSGAMAAFCQGLSQRAA
jgi:hypothetical protein